MASAARLSLLVVAALALAGCFDISTQPSPLVSRSAASERAFVLEKTVRAGPSGGRSRALRGGTAWIEVGAVAEGTVYRPSSGILTAEDVNVREAYIVVRDSAWVGLWLPAEKAFAPLTESVPIAMKQGGQE